MWNQWYRNRAPMGGISKSSLRGSSQAGMQPTTMGGEMTIPARMSRFGAIGLVLALVSACASFDRSDSDLAGISRLADRLTSELPADKRDALLDAADAALKAERMEDAYARYAEVLKYEPKNARAVVGLSEAYLATGDAQRALVGFEQVGETSALSAVARQGQGLALARMGKFELALKQLDLAVAKDPKLWRSWSARGYIHDLSGKWQAADESYRKALEIKSDSPVVHNNRGMSLLMRGRFAEAAAAFQQALRLDPHLAAARANMRLALAWQGRYLEAATGVHGPEAAATLNNIGFVAMKKGHYARAELYFTQAIKASPAHYDKAQRNLQYVRQLRGAQAGDETRALSPTN